ncbi:hypothetical protein [Clostridium brassicae]|uniref:DUF2187 domain-containing protein n=1 Tax=Clostridium brassicae TaxID=2999072 RepID=A0ABT4DCV3_9CLOT|nr:hypothetical protein [Clostridium brassicae]MCY6958849.1 hypothetical protein [Clostridium brassicae]
MKIIVMKAEKDSWYSKKIGKVFSVIEKNDSFFITKHGFIKIEDTQIIESR